MRLFNRIIPAVAAVAVVAIVSACSTTEAPTSAGLVSRSASTLSGGEVLYVCKFGPIGTSGIFSVTATSGTLPSGSTFTIAAKDATSNWTLANDCVVAWAPDVAGVVATVTVQEIGSLGGNLVPFRIASWTDLGGESVEHDPTSFAATVLVEASNGGVIAFKNDFGEIPPPPPGGEGCTPGYWKQSQHFDSWVGYTPNQQFSSVFANAFPGKTLLQVLGAKGGGLNALGRHTVAALLNASSNVDSGFTTAEVIALFNAAYAAGPAAYENQKNIFAVSNELGCPLN